MRINHFKTIQNNPYKKQVPHMNEIHVKSAYKRTKFKFQMKRKSYYRLLNLNKTEWIKYRK